MITDILQRAQETGFDFRAFACPADDLRDRFESWVPYYRLKYAIAEALQPSTILEIGVRYGYSAATFLSACPTAHYTGIDLDTTTYGGAKGAIDWARQILPADRVDLIVGDSSRMDRLPGGHYDLIHVDGQQDEEAIYHDLTLAMAQGSYALVDGYLWTPLNFRGANEFILRHTDLISFYQVIPGYAGELLIKFVEPATRGAASEPGRSAGMASGGDLRAAYAASHFNHDCDSYETFERERMKQHASLRLQHTVELANLHGPARVLALGPRGRDVAREFTRIGREVVVLDDAALRSTPIEEPFDAVVADDLIEHLSAEDAEPLLDRVAAHLSPDGIFVVHTCPNKWLHQYDYARRRRIAASVGACLPANPRSRVARALHVNEQSPRSVRQQLGRRFPHVRLWFAAPEDPAGSLVRRYSIRECAAAPDVYAVASMRALPVADLASLWQATTFGADGAARVLTAVRSCPAVVAPGELFRVRVEVRNGSALRLSSRSPRPVHVAYHWQDGESSNRNVHDGRRTAIVPSIAPGETRTMDAELLAPGTAGPCLLQVRLVQEGVRWFAAGVDADRLVSVG
jgi:hypothetical protein